MPSSESGNIDLIITWVRAYQPKTLLDIGVGTAKFGLMFRDYLDGHWVGHAFHDKSTWTMRMVGVEIFKNYLTPVHDYLYDEILTIDIYEYLKSIQKSEKFDLIFMGDILEHFPKDVGIKLIDLLRDKCLNIGGHIIISTPNVPTRIDDPRSIIFGNDHEVHRCRWYSSDFDVWPGFVNRVVATRSLTVAMEKVK